MDIKMRGGIMVEIKDWGIGFSDENLVGDNKAGFSHFLNNRFDRKGFTPLGHAFVYGKAYNVDTRRFPNADEGCTIRTSKLLFIEAKGGVDKDAGVRIFIAHTANSEYKLSEAEMSPAFYKYIQGQILFPS